MSAIRSLLRQGLENLPEGAKLKGKSIPNTLKKAGVRDEELEYSGMNSLSALNPEQQFTRDELIQQENFRRDLFNRYEIGPHDASYQGTSLAKGKNSPTYQENVYTFANQAELPEGGRYTSAHFPDIENYLMHTRTYNDVIGGDNSLVVQEIQSDLHQAALRSGYGETTFDSQAVDEALNLYHRAADFWYENSDRIVSEDDAMEMQFEALQQLRRYNPNLSEDQDLTGITVEGFRRMAESGGSIPESPYQRSWLAKGIEREIDNAYQNNLDSIVIPIRDVGEALTEEQEELLEQLQIAMAQEPDNLDQITSLAFDLGIDPEENLDAAVRRLSNSVVGEDSVRALSRSEGVQRWYESQVANTARKIAKAQQMDFDTITQNGVEYVRLRFRPDSEGGVQAPRNLTLYSSPAAAVGAGYAALNDGQSEAQVRAGYAEQGFDEEEINEIMADVNLAQQLRSEGYPDEEVLNFFADQEQQVDVENTVVNKPENSLHPWQVENEIEPSVKQTWYNELVNEAQDQADPSRLVAGLYVTNPNMETVFTRMSAFFGNEEDIRAVQEAEQASAQKIVNELRKLGVDAYAELPSQNEDVSGQGFGAQVLQNLELASGGTRFYMNTENGPQEITPGFFDSILVENEELRGAIGGGIAGGAYGFTVGGPLGALVGSVLGAAGGGSLGSQLDYLREAMFLQQDLSAGVAAHRAYTAAEASVIGDAVAYPAAKGLGYSMDGIRFVKDLILDGQNVAAYKAMKDLLFLTDDEAQQFVDELASVATVPGRTARQRRIAATVLTHPQGHDIMETIATVDAKASRAVADQIRKRGEDVTNTIASATDDNVAKLLRDDLNNYTIDVKNYYRGVKKAAAESPAAGNFSFNFDELAINPVLEEIYQKIEDPFVKEKFFNRMSTINAKSESRTLSDLLELRQLVNEFRFNKRVVKADDRDLLNGIIDSIDGNIEAGAQATMKNPTEWLNSYYSANSQYSQMKQLERNVLARALRRPGINQETVVKAVGKYITALDGTFNDVVEVLPKQTRGKVENAVIQSVADKYTSNNVIHFPKLMDDLDQVNFTTPEARSMKEALGRMAAVFRNDVNLANSTGNIQLPKFQSYLTTDPIIRAKFEAASGIFNFIKRLAPTQQGRNLALINKAATLLENPLNARSFNEVMEAANGDVNLSRSLVKLQQEQAKGIAENRDTSAARVHFTEENGVLTFAKANEGNTNVSSHRIATYDIIQNTADKYSIDVNNKELLNQALKAEGFEVRQTGTDRVERIR